MFNISVEIKQGSAVLFERFLANLWSNQSSFWLQRYLVYNLFGVFSADPVAGIKVTNRPRERIFILPLTQLVPTDQKPRFKNNNQCLSIAITRSYQLLKVISIMKNTGLHWITFIQKEIILKISGRYRCLRSISDDTILRPII